MAVDAYTAKPANCGYANYVGDQVTKDQFIEALKECIRLYMYDKNGAADEMPAWIKNFVPQIGNEITGDKAYNGACIGGIPITAEDEAALFENAGLAAMNSEGNVILAGKKNLGAPNVPIGSYIRAVYMICTSKDVIEGGTMGYLLLNPDIQCDYTDTALMRLQKLLENAITSDEEITRYLIEFDNTTSEMSFKMLSLEQYYEYLKSCMIELD